MMITGDQLICHAIGDYILQSQWMSTEKTKRSLAAFLHVCTYSIPFLFLRPSITAMLFIAGSHFVIDRWRLARFLIWTKNHMAPVSKWEKWQDCTATGYHKDIPPWMSAWLLIVADNVLHVLCNALALAYLN